MASNLTAYAIDGYNGKKNDHFASSPAYYAHALGEFFKSSGRSEPRECAMSRGYSMRVNDMIFMIERKDGRDIFTRRS